MSNAVLNKFAPYKTTVFSEVGTPIKLIVHPPFHFDEGEYKFDGWVMASNKMFSGTKQAIVRDNILKYEEAIIKGEQYIEDMINKVVKKAEANLSSKLRLRAKFLRNTKTKTKTSPAKTKTQEFYAWALECYIKIKCYFYKDWWPNENSIRNSE